MGDKIRRDYWNLMLISMLECVRESLEMSKRYLGGEYFFKQKFNEINGTIFWKMVQSPSNLLSRLALYVNIFRRILFFSYIPDFRTV